MQESQSTRSLQRRLFYSAIGGLLLSGLANLWFVYRPAAAPVVQRQIIRPAEGQAYYVPHFQLIDGQGQPVDSAHLLDDRPLVLCFGSFT